MGVHKIQEAAMGDAFRKFAGNVSRGAGFSWAFIKNRAHE
jgi:hypothetical protein